MSSGKQTDIETSATADTQAFKKRSAKAEHQPQTYFSVEEKELMCGGKSMAELAAIAGQTPFYVYDRKIIERKIGEFREAMPSGISLHYAMKANPMPALVSYIADLVDGLDLASLLEMHTALATRASVSNISFAGPGKSIQDIEGAVAAGITLNLESFTEFERALEAGERLGIAPQLAVRVNPDFELKTSGMKMGGGPKQFGVDAEEVPQLVRRIKASQANFRGFHIYSGSQNLKAEALIDAHNKTFALAKRLADEADTTLQKLNIGGGFGIPYFPGERSLDLQPIGENLSALLSEYEAFLGQTEVIIELGRFLVGEAGLYVCQITDKKVSRGHTYLVANGGLHHHLSNSGNFGQVIRKNYPVSIANNMGAADTEVASIVGPLCTPLDTLADKMELPMAKIGDYVAIHQSGAYGPTASPRGFLSQPDLVELFV